MTVKLVSFESYLSEFSIVSMENPDIYKCRNSDGLFPSNSQTPYDALSFVYFCSNFRNVRFKNDFKRLCKIFCEFLLYLWCIYKTKALKIFVFPGIPVT